ncbi:MAG: 2-phospho-L-lactate transferase [Rhodobacteraceae bacterium]|nr:2-phospho-L-lactate transferase [Paracoccaceae bacterium]
MTPAGSGKTSSPKVLALSGGIGGAKLDLGLYHVLDPWDLAIVANTGDDFEHLGLTICPDLDTIMYTLSGTSDEAKGWGRKDETWACLEQLKALGGSSWFGLGDKDLAVHLYRSALLREGKSLGEITASLFARFGVKAHVLPMADQAVGTIIHTKDGRNLPFQHYFVKERCAPEITGLTYQGAQTAKPPAALLEIIQSGDLRAVIIAPSNPFVSINPILSVPGIRAALAASNIPVVAVSPLINGAAIKGPLARMLVEMGLPATNRSIADQYKGLLSGMVIDTTDKGDADTLQDLPVLAVNTLMNSLEDRMRLAQDVLEFADRLRE